MAITTADHCLAKEVVDPGLMWTLRSSSSQKCSIGFRSGDQEGQSRILTSLASKNAVVALAVCGLHCHARTQYPKLSPDG